MKCVLANPNVAPHIRHSLLAYYESSNLKRFYTGFYYNPRGLVNRLVEKTFPAVGKELNRRSIREVPHTVIKSRPLPELLRVFSMRKLNAAISDSIWEWSEIGFDRWVASQLAKDISWVHTCEHAGLATLEKAKKLNVMSVYEQPSQHHAFFTEIVHRQLKAYPEFKKDEFNLMVDKNAVRRNKRRDQELHTADWVLCNSGFTKATLLNAGISEHKIMTIPLGFPEVKQMETRTCGEKVVFLYAGNLSLRKGIHILLQAWKEEAPEKAELWLVGRKALPDVFFHDLPNNVRLFPNVPHAELMQMYQQANVFILPTLADGFGMVLTEAMSCGLPVITTFNSGGPDLIDHEKEGLLIAAEEKEAVKESIRWCMHNQNNLPEMGRKAAIKASAYPWAAYRKKLIADIVYRVKQ